MHIIQLNCIVRDIRQIIRIYLKIIKFQLKIKSTYLNEFLR